MAWGEPAEANRGPQIVLSDGSLLVADIVRGDDQNLLVDSAALGEVALPLPVVAGIILNPPAAPRRARPTDRSVDAALDGRRRPSGRRR